LTKNVHGRKVIVCNADEGEVGTFKDRMMIEKYPAILLEGIAIAALAMGTNKAIIYLRWEYSFLKPVLEENIKTYGCKFNMVYEIRMGAGAYVCGEETALLDSLEGKRGETRNKPPFPNEEGYKYLPTLVNNVETLCCIPLIINNGAEAFAVMGTEKSTGPKLFSISGDVKKPGVYEFPMGVTLKKLLDTAQAEDTKAALVSGASGYVVDKKDFKRKLAYEDLPPGGSIVVFNKKRDMLRVMKNLTEFFVEESCGQCTPCREGVFRIYEFIEKMERDKQVSQKEMDRYLELAKVMCDASKCGLGQTAANPFSFITALYPKEIAKVVSNQEVN